MLYPSSRRSSWLVATVVFVLMLGIPCGPLSAQEVSPPPDAEAAAEEPTWTVDLGLSYLATTGNSESNSLGASAAYVGKWGLWGLTAGLATLRAEADGETTAENVTGFARGSRDLTSRLALTAGVAALQDELAGIDLRTVTDVAARWSFLDTERWGLAALAGPSWTYEGPVAGDSDSSFGAIAQLDGRWTLSETAGLTARFTYLPNFDVSDDYRMEGELGAQAALSSWLSLAVGYLWLYDNVPVPGFEKTDTRTTVSLVVHWGAQAADCPCA